MAVTGAQFAQTAYSFRNSGLTYQQYDCMAFVNLVRTTCGLPAMSSGTNTCWRSNNLTWKGTIAEAKARWGGSLPQGILLFKIHPEGTPGYDTIPARYYGDGIGNVTHVGIYTGLGMGVMQSGGYGGRGVHDSGWQAGYWTHCALQMGVEYAEPTDPYFPPNPPDPEDPDEPSPLDPPTPVEPYIMTSLWYLFYKRKELLKTCRRM